jgi:hypothetical protein
MDNESLLKEWTIGEYRTHEKSRRWYYVAIGIILMLLILAIWSENIFAAVSLLLLSVIILVRAYSDPPELNVFLTEDGIAVGDRFYDFKDLDNFWIVYEPPEVKMLYVEFVNRWRPRLPIPLQNEDPVAIREILLNYLTENESREGEPVSDLFGRWLKL